jgi:RecG-like helicase
MPAIEAQHAQSGSNPVLIAYIGNKEIKKDTQCRTGVTWYGQFDVQAVDPVPASRLLKFSSVWIRAEQLEKYRESIEAALVKEAEQEEVAPKVSEPETEAEPDAESEVVDQAGADHLEAIQTVITSLDQENPEHFTGAGKPKIEAIRTRMPDCEVSAAEVTEAFKALGAS